MPAVSPNILIWARETAGLTVDDAASKLGIKAARGVEGAERLLAYERGDTVPSRPLLLRMSKTYRRPLLTFYLREPPERGDRGEDFRSLPQQHTTMEPLVDALVRDVRARQAMVRSVMDDDEDVAPLAFVGSMGVESGVAQVVESIRQHLDVDVASFRNQGTVDDAFAHLRSRVESAGVFVLLIGNLGSHHTTLDVSAFRGFALADPIAPFVVINDQDAKSAWAFTLLHELVHLWIGATGVSGTFGESRVERFCNDVASEFLVPANEIATISINRRTGQDEAARLISAFSETRFVSRSMVAYRLFRAGRIDEANWISLAAAFHREWLRMRGAQRDRAREQEGGPSYYVVRRHRLGSALLQFVDRNMSEGLLTPTKAGRVLGVKPRNVAPLLSALHRQVA